MGIATYILEKLSILPSAREQIVPAIGFLMCLVHDYVKGKDINDINRKTSTGLRILSRAQKEAIINDNSAASCARRCLFNLRKDTAATIIQCIAKTFIAKKRVTILRKAVGEGFILPTLGELKDQLN